ncbi:MAG: hypothetical protein NZ455_13565 [Bacteroidia bacterium]|nr:hypothetical protein [Bacteroidia bacterium]
MVFIAVITALYCGYIIFPKSNKLVLESATMQEWAGGAAGSGRGITYRIVAKKRPKKAVKISSVWIGNAQNGKTVDFIVTTMPKGPKEVNISDRVEDITDADKILIEATLYLSRPVRRLPDDPEVPEDIPKQTEKQICGIENFTGDAYVAYSMGKKIEYLIIEKFQKLEPIFYP